MNKIYKVIWSRVKHMYVVVSELAKSNGKSGEKAIVGSGVAGKWKKAAAAVLVAGTLLPVGMPAAWAEEENVDVPIYFSQTTGNNSWVGRATNGGGGGSLYKSTGTVHFYQVIKVKSDGTVEVHDIPGGNRSVKSVRVVDYNTPGNDSNAADNLYLGTSVSGVMGIAIGNYADILSSTVDIKYNTYTASGIAIGDFSRAKEKLAIAIGSGASATGIGGISLGTSAGSTGVGAVAVGRQTAATNDATVALGVTASAQGAGAVAVGRSSHAKGDRSIAIGTTGGTTSIIQSDDAKTEAAPYDGVHNTESLGNRSIALGIEAKTTEGADDSFAIGNQATAGGAKAMALGYNTSVTNASGATGDNKSIAMGADTTIVGANNVTQGNSINVTGSDNVVQGNSATVTGTKNIVQGSGNTVADSASSTGSTSSIIQGNDNTITGSINHVRGSSNTISGDSNSVDSHGGNVYGSHNLAYGDSVTVGSASHSVNEATALGNSASVTVDGGVALGSGSVASTASGIVGYDPATKGAASKSDAAWQSTLGAVSVSSGSGASRQIVGVAAGTNDTDAANVAQLKAATTEVKQGSNVTVSKSYDTTDGHAIYTINSTASSSGGMPRSRCITTEQKRPPLATAMS